MLSANEGIHHMKHFVLVFERIDGRVLSEREFDDSREALRERFAAESLHRGNANIEVVVLGAGSSADLRRTHARYFSTVGALAREGVARVRGVDRASVG